MSTASTFAYKVKSASINNDRPSMLDAFYEYQDTHCLHPINVRVTDNHTQTRRLIQVPCGKCWHCQQSKINEWCTRMYAHAEDFKHVYFVTLTYRSITDPNNPVNKLMLSKLGQAVWHRDAFNQTKHMCYRPCLLVKKHYQDFLKRLRFNTGLSDLTYVVAGEYGHKYGGPHFHFILFTNGTLQESDIRKAWSLSLWRTNQGEWKFRTNQVNNGSAYSFPLGRIDFDPLVEDGSFNYGLQIKVDGTYMNAGHCFAYVCKYVVKRESANLCRVNMAYNNLFVKKTFTKVFDNDVPYEIVKKYLKSVGYKTDYINDLSSDLKHLSYEKSIYQPSQDVSEYGLCRSKRVKTKFYNYNVDLLPDGINEFRHSFRPFCEFSRGTPIGSLYAKRNIQEFAEGVFTKPNLQRNGFVVPRYFRLKAQDYLYGIRKLRKTIKGQSSVITGLIDFQGRLNQARENPLLLRENLGNSLPYSYIAEALHDDRSLFIDAYTKERILIYNDHAQHYKYDRHLRNYCLTRAVPVADWIRDQCKRLNDELCRASVRFKRSINERALTERGQLIMQEHGFDFDTVTNSYLIRQQSILTELSKLYHDVHRSAE